MAGRQEARVFTSIWKDKDFLNLEEGPQRLYMFLLSQDDLTYAGTMRLWAPRWASKARGLTASIIEDHLKALEAERFIVVDTDTGELLIRTFIRHDRVWKEPNLLKSARSSAELIESPEIRAVLLAELQRIPIHQSTSNLVHEIHRSFINDLTVGGTTPPGTPNGEASGIPPANPTRMPAAETPCETTAPPTSKGHAYPTTDPNVNTKPGVLIDVSAGQHPRVYPTANPSGYPTAEASPDPSQGKGEGYGSYHRGSPYPVSPEPLSPTSGPTQGRSRGTRLPKNFEVTREMVTWCRDRCPDIDGAAQTERFINHWRSKAGKDGVKLDWTATWRNWMLKAQSDLVESRARYAANGGAARSTTTDRVAMARQAGIDAQAILDAQAGRS